MTEGRTEIAVPCEDGVVLQVERIPARGRARGVAVVLHAMMVDRRSMDRPTGAGLASTLASEGWEVWNADFRGHGGSVAAQWSYDDLVLRDVPALVAAARAAGGPVWIVGLSLGGHVSLASVASGACAPDGLVLLSANVWLPSLEPSLGRRLLKHLSGRLLLSLTRGLGRFPSRRLRVGPSDESLDYIEDLIRFWREDRWASREGVDWRSGLAAVELPVLGVVGRGDRLLAHPVAARRFIEPIPNMRFVTVGRGDCGLARDPTHMALATSADCVSVWRWLAGWMAHAG